MRTTLEASRAEANKYRKEGAYYIVQDGSD